MALKFLGNLFQAMCSEGSSACCQTRERQQQQQQQQFFQLFQLNLATCCASRWLAWLAAPAGPQIQSTHTGTRLACLTLSSLHRWLIAIAYWLSGGFIKSGLGNRIAYAIVSVFGKTTLGLTYSLVFAEALLAPAIPSVSLQHQCIPGCLLYAGPQLLASFEPTSC